MPDVLVTKVGRGAQARFRVQLNPDVMPRLRVHDIYAGALKSHKGEGHQALQQRLQEARWFIKNIQQRFDTILRVSNAIVERQKNFFVHGELAMRPLVLREIADELGLHESTISRVTTAKYMSTPYRHLRAQVFLRLRARHRDRRQCIEHGGARADQAVRRRGEPEEAAVGQPDLRHAQGAGHRVRAPHRRQIPRGAAHRARQSAQRALVNGTAESAQLFLPCAAGVEGFLADEVHRLTGLAGDDLLTGRGGVQLRASWRDAMRLNLHSRLAQRVLVQLSHTPYRSENDLYEAASGVAWEDLVHHQARASRSR